MLGACLPYTEADAFCGPGGRAGSGGCSFRTCEPGELLDVASGTCLPRGLVHGSTSCGPDAAPLVEEGRVECVPALAACPRSTKPVAQAASRALGCEAGPACPPGTIVAPREHAGASCWPVVASTPDGPRVDLGSWVALALGPDGGIGADALCRPIARRPSAFGLSPGHEVQASVRVVLVVPDQDLTRLRATATARDAASGDALAPAALAVVRSSVDSLVEALRGLGGEASAAVADVTVRCPVRSL